METLFSSRKAGWMRADEWLTNAPTPVPTRSYEQVYRWCTAKYPKSWRVKEMTDRIWRWEGRIARRLAALRELAKRRIAACRPEQFLVRERYRAVLAMIERAESRIAKLAYRPAKRIKARLARLAAALEQCSEPKQNGVSSAAPPPFTPPSDDPEYDELWEERMWWRIHGDAWMQFFPESDERVLDEEDIASRLSGRLLIQLHEKQTSYQWEVTIRRPHRSWKSNRRTKWRVLGNPSVVLSINPT